MTRCLKQLFKTILLTGLVFLVVAACHASTLKFVTVVKVHDGDTVTLANGQTVRYMGIDTPEMGFEDKKPEPFGPASARFNRKLTLGKQVRLEPSKQQTDRFGRRLAHVFTKEDILVGEALLLEGLANCFLFEPHPHEKRFLKAQRRAMNDQKGRWRRWQEPFPKQAYLGNRRSMRFHRTDCKRAKSISPKNRVRYKTMWDAYYDGYAPARGCLP